MYTIKLYYTLLSNMKALRALRFVASLSAHSFPTTMSCLRWKPGHQACYTICNVKIRFIFLITDDYN